MVLQRVNIFHHGVSIKALDIQGLDKTMETLRNSGTEIVCVGYTERTSVGNNECFYSICLHSVVLVTDDSVE
jgi:hypothetical protein